MEPRAATELASEFRRLGDFINRDVDPAGALTRLTRLAVRTVAGCDWATITRAGAVPHTWAASSPVAQRVDDVQTRCNEGPCLTAAREGTVVHVPDLTRESAWSEFVASALTKTPVRAISAFALGTRAPQSSLNLYAGRAHAFTKDSMSMAALFVSHAQMTMMHLHAATKTANLEQALTTSRQIGAAIGVLMTIHKVTEDQAFDLLRTSSQHLNRKLRDVAVEVTETGTLP